MLLLIIIVRFFCREDSHDFALKECAAYGPVSSTQGQYEVISSPQTEGTYESVLAATASF